MATRTRARRFGPIALSLLVVACLLVSALAGSLGPRNDSSGLRTALSYSLLIAPNGTVSVAGVFSVHGDTYTQIANYTGAIEDARNGSLLVGAGFVIDHNVDSAGVLVSDAANVTMTGLNITGTGTGIYLDEALFTDVSDSVLSVTGDPMFVIDSTSASFSAIQAPGSSGADVQSSSDVTISDSNFSGSSSDGIDVAYSSGVTLSNDDFSHAESIGLNAEESTDIGATGNRFDDAGSGYAIVLDGIGFSNVSSNNLTGTAGLAEPVVVEDSDNVGLWDNALSAGDNISFAINGSTNVRVGDSASPDPGEEGVDLLEDSGVVLRDVEFNDAGNGVVDLDSSDVSIDDSEFESGDVSVYAVGAVGLTVDDSNLTQGNDGVVTYQSSSISIANSNLSRSNYPLFLVADTTGVSVTGSELDRAQVDAVQLVDASNISLSNDTAEGSSGIALNALDTEGLEVSDTDFAGTPTDLGPEAIEEVSVNDSTFTNDSFDWTLSPFSANDSSNIQIVGSDFANSSGAYAVGLEQDQQVLVSDCDFANDTAEGVIGETVTELTLTGSNLAGVHDDGFAVDGGTDLVVSNDTFDNGEDTGVFVDGAYGLLADDNSLTNVANAFFLNGGDDWVIVNNTANADSDGGLMANSASGLLVEGNNFSEQSGDMAIDLTAIDNFEVTANVFVNDSSALDISGLSQGTVVGNEFLLDSVSMDVDGIASLLTYHNDFVDDSGWVLDSTGLAWDDGYPVGGNYWSNYTGVDEFHGPGQNLSGSDGIGDTPFVLDSENIDRYPLMTPWTDHVATFVESGLPAGSTWVVVFNGTTYRTNSTSLTVTSTVGVDTPYEYSVPNVGGLAATPSSGSGELGVGVVLIRIAFAVPTYALTLSETGLPLGMPWTVTIDGTTLSGTDTYVLDLPNGTYDYSIALEPGYLTSSESGLITISGAAEAFSATFVPFTYDVVIVESGLPDGAHWSITVGSSTWTSSGTTLAEDLANGTYLFGVVPVGDFTATPGNGSWTVNGSAIHVYITFASNVGYPGGPTEVAGSSVLFYVIIGVVVAVAAAGWALFLRRRRGGTPASPPPGVLPPPPPPGAT